MAPSVGFSQNIGNTYTAAAFANLLCLVSTEGDNLAGKRVGVFSYGSGAIATLYALEVRRVMMSCDQAYTMPWHRVVKPFAAPPALSCRGRAQSSICFLLGCCTGKHVVALPRPQPRGALAHSLPPNKHNECLT